MMNSKDQKKSAAKAWMYIITTYQWFSNQERNLKDAIPAVNITNFHVWWQQQLRYSWSLKSDGMQVSLSECNCCWRWFCSIRGFTAVLPAIHIFWDDTVSLGECFFRTFESTMIIRNVSTTQSVTYTQVKTVTEVYSLTGLPWRRRK
jgi:hypothetical protein